MDPETLSTSCRKQDPLYVHMDHLMKGELPKPVNREPAQPVWTPSVIPQGLSTCSPSPTPEEVPVLCLLCKEAQPHIAQSLLHKSCLYFRPLFAAAEQRLPLTKRPKLVLKTGKPTSGIHIPKRQRLCCGIRRAGGQVGSGDELTPRSRHSENPKVNGKRGLGPSG